MQNDVGVPSLDLFNVNGSFKSINIANNSPGDFLQIADNLIWDILKLLLCWEDAVSGRSVSGWSLVTGGCVTICRIRCEVLGVPPRCDGWGCYCGLRCPDTDIKIPPIPAQPSVHQPTIWWQSRDKTSAISHQHLQSGICRSQGSSTQLMECGGADPWLV